MTVGRFRSLVFFPEVQRVRQFRGKRSIAAVMLRDQRSVQIHLGVMSRRFHREKHPGAGSHSGGVQPSSVGAVHLVHAFVKTVVRHLSAGVRQTYRAAALLGSVQERVGAVFGELPSVIQPDAL